MVKKSAEMSKTTALNRTSSRLVLMMLATGWLSLGPLSGCRRGSEREEASPSRPGKNQPRSQSGPKPSKLSSQLALRGDLDLPPGIPHSQLQKMPHLKVLLESMLKVQRRYVDPDALDPVAMFVHGLREVQEDVAAVQVRFLPKGAKKPRTGVVQVGKSRLPFSLVGIESQEESYAYFRYVLGFIREELEKMGDFSKEDVDELEYTAINGFLDTLDPYSVLLPPKTYGEMKIRTSGSFGGIGIVISIRDGALTVISPIDGTPAARAGIQPSDRIVRIGPESTVNMPLHEAVSRLRGKVGTKVTFWIERDGLTAPKRYTLTRARIEIHSVKSKVLRGKVGYLRVSRFSENTRPELKQHITKLVRAGCESMVLDLTNNPGGLLSQAIAVASTFLNKGTIVVTEGARGVRLDVKKAKSGDTLWRGPLVVLVNRGSASAAEIVAGSLKHLGRAVVMGERTFGKGTVQVLMRNSDRSALKLTVARYLVRGDVPIQTVGIVPDIMTVPVAVRKGWVRFNTLQKRSGEEKLREHLSPGRKVEVPDARWTLKYLRKERNEDETKNAAEPDMGADPTVRELARDLLVRHRGTRKEMLAECQQFVTEEAKAQQRRIARAVGKLGVDWSAPPKNTSIDPPRLSLSVATENKKTPVTAGEKLRIKMTVTNAGESTAWRVRAMLEAPAYYINGKELLFGKLEPGKSRSWTTEIEVPSHARSQTQPLTAKVYTMDKEIGDVSGVGSSKATPYLVAIEQLDRPFLALDYRFVELKGDGDGVVEAGEQGAIDCKVTNRGPGKGERVVASVRNLSGKWLYLEKGRAVIDKLKPGESQSVRLTFHLQKKGVEPKLEIELGVYEPVVRVGFEQRMELSLAKPASELSGHIEPPVIELEQVPTSTTSETIPIDGVIKHPRSVKDYYIFVSNDSRKEEGERYRRKVHYRAAASPATTKLIADTEVRLPIGLNTIVVLARNSKHLTSYRLLHVLRLAPSAGMSVEPARAPRGSTAPAAK